MVFANDAVLVGESYTGVAVVSKTSAEDREYYYLLKDLYTVAGLVDESGEVVEGYAYDAYGKVRMYRLDEQIADADRDGVCR